MQSQLEENEQIILNEQKRRKKKHLNIDTAKEKPKQINSLAQLEFYSLMDSDSVVFFFFRKFWVSIFASEWKLIWTQNGQTETKQQKTKLKIQKEGLTVIKRHELLKITVRET